MFASVTADVAAPNAMSGYTETKGQSFRTSTIMLRRNKILQISLRNCSIRCWLFLRQVFQVTDRVFVEILPISRNVVFFSWRKRFEIVILLHKIYFFGLYRVLHILESPQKKSTFAKPIDALGLKSRMFLFWALLMQNTKYRSKSPIGSMLGRIKNYGN